jgi:hypothetical protein
VQKPVQAKPVQTASIEGEEENGVVVSHVTFALISPGATSSQVFTIQNVGRKKVTLNKVTIVYAKRNVTLSDPKGAVQGRSVVHLVTIYF